MSKGMSILLVVLGVILFLMSLLLLIVSPWALIGIAFSVLIIIYAARNMKKLKDEAAKPKPSFKASFSSPSPSAPTVRSSDLSADLSNISTRRLDAVGMRFRMDSVRDILDRNPEYRYAEDITKKYYLYLPFTGQCELVPEDDNPYDHNAVKIVVNGTHVAYVAARQCLRARDALAVGCTFNLCLYGGTNKTYDEAESKWIVHRDDISGYVTIQKPSASEA